MEAAPGYELDKEYKTVYVQPVKLGVTITKRGNAQALAGSQMRYDFTVANTSNVPLEKLYWHERIPTQTGEYVTDVFLEFGNVPVGFQSTGKPTLTVQVLGTVPNGYQIVNRAGAGGPFWLIGQETGPHPALLRVWPHIKLIRLQIFSRPALGAISE